MLSRQSSIFESKNPELYNKYFTLKKLIGLKNKINSLSQLISLAGENENTHAEIINKNCTESLSEKADALHQAYQESRAFLKEQLKQAQEEYDSLSKMCPLYTQKELSKAEKVILISLSEEKELHQKKNSLPPRQTAENQAREAVKQIALQLQEKRIEVKSDKEKFTEFKRAYQASYNSVRIFKNPFSTMLSQLDKEVTNFQEVKQYALQFPNTRTAIVLQNLEERWEAEIEVKNNYSINH